MPSSGEVKRFMKPARELAAAFIQILDGEDQSPDVENAVLIAAGGMAFAMAQAYMQRPFFLGTYCERYFAVGFELKLRVVPVESVAEVKANGTVLEQTVDPMDPKDYELKGDRIIFGQGILGLDLASQTFTRGLTGAEADFLFSVVEVTYAGGYSNSADDASFNNAMAEQVAAQYRRAPFIGLSAASGGNQTGSVTVGSDKGSMIDGVALQLDPLVYFGQAEELRCP